MKININLGNWNWILQTRLTERRTEFVYGYTNRCSDNCYIITLDYDRLELEWIEQELKFLQEYFWLGDFHIFKSSEDQYHAVCLDKVTLSEYLNILRCTSIDHRYMDVPLKWGKKIWVLRVSDKNNQPITYTKVIKSDLCDHKQSLAHADFLNTIFKLKIKLERPDGLKKLILAKYPI